MNARPVQDAKYWRERAVEARAVAEEMLDPETKRILEGIAQSYDRLAQHAKTREDAEAKKADNAGT